jgi:hypothetical protein
LIQAGYNNLENQKKQTSMKKSLYLLITCFCMVCVTSVHAGNPDRQGEAGAYELLLNPWARSSGLHTMTTSMITGVEATRLNVAGLARLSKSELVIGHTILFDGTGMSLNSLGFAQRVGTSGGFALTLTAMDFGDIQITTDAVPEGIGATYSPSFFHMGMSYAHMFENKVSVGILLCGISESIADLNAFGFAVDAGVQYVAGEQDNFKFGIALRNVGTPMRFGGEGLSFQTPNPDGDVNYPITVNQRAAKFELPSVLNLGTSYDFLFGTRHRFTVLANFTANSFSRDQIGGGAEYAFREMFMVRAGYKHEMGATDIDRSIYTGLAAGVTIEVPTKKQSTSRFAVDYAYSATNPFSGTHNFSLRYKI